MSPISKTSKTSMTPKTTIDAYQKKFAYIVNAKVFYELYESCVDVDGVGGIVKAAEFVRDEFVQWYDDSIYNHNKPSMDKLKVRLNMKTREDLKDLINQMRMTKFISSSGGVFIM